MTYEPERIWAFHAGPMVGYFVGKNPGSGTNVNEYVCAEDYDAIAAKLAEVKAGRDKWSKRAMEMVAERNDARDALPAVYRLGLRDAAVELECNWGHIATPQMRDAIRALPTPTATELMARIQTGEKE